MRCSHSFTNASNVLPDMHGLITGRWRAGSGSTGVKDKPSAKAAKSAPGEEYGGGAGGDEEGETYYDAMKKEMGDRAARTRAALDAMDPEQRVAMEGHRPGAYLRLCFSGATFLSLSRSTAFSEQDFVLAAIISLSCPARND